MRSYHVFLWLVFLRLLSVFVVQTFFVPDEYWQSVEVAHNLAFGYGFLTWEWTTCIRSFVYPSIFAVAFKVLEFFNLDTAQLVILTPRILQALLSAYADYRFYKWTQNSKWGLFLVSTSWLWFFTGSRTLINTLETALTTIALSIFPWKTEKTGFLWIVSLLCFLRPTAAIPWLPLCLYHLKKSHFPVWEVILKRYMLIGLTTLAFTTAIDSYFYGRFIVTPYEFIKINVLDGIASNYGTSSWYWYITEGLASALGITLVPFLLATNDTVRNQGKHESRKIILISILCTVIGLSFISHKEIRFLMPILPMSMFIVSDYLSRWSRKASSIKIWAVTLIMLFGNILPAAYFSVIHQRGAVAVMNELKEEISDYQTDTGLEPKIMFFMCHGTPFYSHIHKNVTMSFLRCEPNLLLKENYTNMAEDFYKDPPKWLRKNMLTEADDKLPTHAVLFDSLVPKMGAFLAKYEQKRKIFHTQIVIDEYGGENIMVYERIARNPEAKDNVDEPNYDEGSAEEAVKPEQA